MEIQALSQLCNSPSLLSLHRQRQFSSHRVSPFPRRSLWRGQGNPYLKHGVSVQCALTKNMKEEIVGDVIKQLENCHLIASIKYKGLTVKQFTDLRKSLPESTKLLVIKNRLVIKAIEGTQFEALKPCMKGQNAYMFVHSEEIPVALKPYRDFQKQEKLEANDFVGAVFEGKFYPPEEFKALETMPTRAEIYSKLLGSLQSPAISVLSTLQAPARDLVFTLKAYVQKLEEEAGSTTIS
ncbi:hypothetical protein SUGI_0846270 [Cryptomeria japonica]|uniref:large ribosomal subunit protein uL10c n=1 Tax=Cryptomeria japonica TaxID=3369 RepID=UPI002414B9DC|nr:large ribosomal subunit protein uL10c [Cryptomeria japonica]GLJ40909.1 hypothetical protein SUGI_0846270 [Cryptomeria japonica]